MSEARLNVRIDADIKARAEYVFRKLGLNMSSGISIFLSKVAADQAIPFPLSLERATVIGEGAYRFEQTAVASVHENVSKTVYSGLPVARYDNEKNCPYLEYPDGRKVYNIDE